MSRKRRKLPSGVVYDGPLAEPIYPSFFDVVLGTVEKSAHEQRIRKLPTLLSKYGLDHADPEALMKLALQLAIDHVPGMQIGRARPNSGRPRTWKSGLGEHLVRDVENCRSRSRKKIGVTQAIQYLKRNSPDWGKFEVNTLETRYYEATKELQRKARKAKSVTAAMAAFGISEEIDRDALKARFGNLTISNLKKSKPRE